MTMMIMVRLKQWSNDGGMTNKGGYNVGIIDGQDRAAMLITIAVKMDVINILREGVKKSFFGTLSQTSDPTRPPQTFGTPLSEK